MQRCTARQHPVRGTPASLCLPAAAAAPGRGQQEHVGAAAHAACCACRLLWPACLSLPPSLLPTLHTTCTPCRELVGLGLAGTAPQPDGWVLPSRLKELYFAENPNVTGSIPPGWRLPDSEHALQCMSVRLVGERRAGGQPWCCSHASAAMLSLPLPPPPMALPHSSDHSLYAWHVLGRDAQPRLGAARLVEVLQHGALPTQRPAA